MTFIFNNINLTLFDMPYSMSTVINSVLLIVKMFTFPIF